LFLYYNSTYICGKPALRYLRKENPDVETNTKGWALMMYESMPLGWAKILPNRINNYYPKELRILKEV
jgi:NOL1/NOP2/fmu family ribosome biogenesis protein